MAEKDPYNAKCWYLESLDESFLFHPLIEYEDLVTREATRLEVLEDAKLDRQ